MTLVKRFQQLFGELQHAQIGERLVQLLIAKPAISRTLLILKYSDELYVEAIASHSAEQQAALIRSLNSKLSSLSQLPQPAIGKQFVQPEARYLDREELATLSEHSCPADATGAYLHPIIVDSRCLALFYLETRDGIAALEQAVQELDTLWLFSSLLVQQIINHRQQAIQGERQRLAEQALWASETYLNALLQHSPALISVKDLDGNLVLASEHFKQLANNVQGQFIGNNLFNIFAQDTAQSLWDIDQAAKTNQQTYELEIDLMHADGSLHTYLMVKFALRNKLGHAFGICTIGTDISERKLAEKALREQQSRLNYMAFHDSLTALPNRALFYDRSY